MCLGREHAVDLVEPVGHDVGDLFVVAHPDERDQVDLAGDRVDLAHALQLRDLLRNFRNAVDGGGDEYDRGDHGAALSPVPPGVSARWTPRARRATRPAKGRPNRRSCAATTSGFRAACATAPAIQL